MLVDEREGETGRNRNRQRDRLTDRKGQRENVCVLEKAGRAGRQTGPKQLLAEASTADEQVRAAAATDAQGLSSST